MHEQLHGLHTKNPVFGQCCCQIAIQGQGCRLGAMGPQLVPEQHTVAPNMKFLVPGLAYKFYFMQKCTTRYWAVLLVMVNFKFLNFDTLLYSQMSQKLGRFHKICLPFHTCNLIVFPPQKHYWTYDNMAIAIVTDNHWSYIIRVK